MNFEQNGSCDQKMLLLQNLYNFIPTLAYTGVVLLNDVEQMKGGKLEIMHHDKHDALQLLALGNDYKCEVIDYEHSGKMILAQGSEILHHVTPVTNNATRY